MAYMYYCPKCDQLYQSDDVDLITMTCTRCGNYVFATKISVDEWNAMSDSVKENIKNELKQQSTPTKSVSSESATKEKNSTKSKYGTALSVVGLIYIVISIMGGLGFMGNEPILGFAIILGGSASGLLFLGFAEIIDLLQSIKNKL